jgi:hypothetical protein
VGGTSEGDSIHAMPFRVLSVLVELGESHYTKTEILPSISLTQNRQKQQKTHAQCVFL